MRKVELSVMKPWISDKIIELLGFEDEVVVEYVNGLLDDPTSPVIILSLIIIFLVFKQFLMLSNKGRFRTSRLTYSRHFPDRGP